MTALSVGSLCSGIGLMDLGLEWAGLRPVLWQCEILPERRAVLKHWWPEAVLYDDVRTIGTPAWVDVIAFGSPCKNLSSAGDRSGLDGASSRLFWDCLAVVERVRPRFVIFENVASGASLWVDRVRGALERLGYQTLPVPLAASDCGAPHRRARVFIVAHIDEIVGDARQGVQREERARRAEPARVSVAHLDGKGELAFPEHAEVAGPPVAADADREGLTRRDTRRMQRIKPSKSHCAWRDSQPDMVRVVHGGTTRLDGARARVEALGDSCTPQQSEVIGHIVRLLDRNQEAA